MTQDTAVAATPPAMDTRKLDRLMGLSGELVIIRSQFARAQKLLQHDLARQKELEQGLARARALLEVSFKEPERATKALAELEGVLKQLSELADYEDAGSHIQAMSHTTSALEKASAEIQSGIVQINIDASGGKSGAAAAMAILPALLVVVGGEICAFPLAAVTEIINVPSKDIYTVDGNTTMKLREHALSLIELSRIIQFEANRQEEDSLKRVVVITDGADRLGIIVDSLMGKDEIVCKPLTKHFSGVRGVVGASILADGNVALILDPAMIIQGSRK